MSDRPASAFRRSYWRASFWFVVIFGLLALAFAVFAHTSLRDGRRLAAEGVNTTGAVVDREITTRRNSSGGTRRSYILTVEFRDQAGQAVRSRQSVGSEVYDASAVGTQVQMRYVPGEPSINEMGEGRTATTGMILGGAAGLLGLGAVMGLISLRRTIASQNRAIRHGTVRRARVEQVITQGRKKSAGVVAEWNGLDGKRHKSATMTAAKAPAVGSEVRVHVDPATGREWYGPDLGLSA